MYGLPGTILSTACVIYSASDQPIVSPNSTNLEALRAAALRTEWGRGKNLSAKILAAEGATRSRPIRGHPGDKKLSAEEKVAKRKAGRDVIDNLPYDWTNKRRKTKPI